MTDDVQSDTVGYHEVMSAGLDTLGEEFGSEETIRCRRLTEVESGDWLISVQGSVYAVPEKVFSPEDGRKEMGDYTPSADSQSIPSSVDSDEPPSETDPEYVRVDLLEQLAEQFRGRANFAEKAAGNETAAEVARQNADEIERLIEDAE